ncbi:regulatory LuxR family protein [Salana multivorans]|uniref:Regulatory LuxR family protein n=1 Tax=Salana multivorans TaxID=120377 RepID=A0A3N2D1D4_9MICO|nr:LuxR C-terminal-related transcriptional regulator [Salana multivorans]ROR93590.1 regulatory LuxR family protein [Salana multivorans]
MFVLTVDQQGSRRGSDRVPSALDLLADVEVLLPFERTVGDELQGVPASAEAAVDAVLRLVRAGGWSIGLGVGPGRLAQSASASDGEAFVRAREAVERAKGRTVPVALALAAGEATPDAEPFLHLLAAAVEERTDATWRVLDLLAAGRSGVEIAEELGMTPQNVSHHRRRALWDTEVAARRALARLLTRIDAAGA